MTNNGDLNLVQMPTALPEPKAVDMLVAKELNEMSPNERELILDDLHGVSQTAKEENTEFVSKCLYEMQQAINKTRDKEAYDIAYSQSPNYAGGQFLFLMFLRSASFNVRQAATKLVKYFYYKRIYFGDTFLGRPIRYADLNDDDLECLRSGWIQLLPFRDKAGRAVLWYIEPYRPKKDPMNIMRAMWYITTLMIQDEDTQKSGAIIVGNQGGELDLSKVTREVIWHLSLYENYTPVKLLSCHFCLGDPIAVPLVSLNQLGMGKDTRARTRIHCGSQTEWMYSLMTFGIPVDYAPITSSGSLKTKYFRQWLAQKCSQETLALEGIASRPSRGNIVELPCRTDLLLGKGKLQQLYSGNHLFQQIIQENCERYMAVESRKDRSNICKEVWRILQNEKVRFLERDNVNDVFWVKLSKEAAILSKIAYQLRTMKPLPKFEVMNKHSADKNESKVACYDANGGGSILNKPNPSSGCGVFQCCASSSVNKNAFDDNHNKNNSRAKRRRRG